MLFHTPEFFLLLIVTLMLFYTFPKWRLYIIALANMLFYGVSGWGFLVLFLAVTTLTYYGSLLLQGRYGKIFLWLIVGVNLCNLFFFKYSVFFMQNLGKMLDMQLVTENSFWLTIVLPIGISFYTFEFISYSVDVYKKKIKPAQSWIDFWIFVAFFAHLVAGPIMRGNEFLPQVEQIRSLKPKIYNFKMGAFFLMLGLFKKIMLADYLAEAVNKYFAHPELLTGSQAWVVTYLFAFQIYYDFSAYSDMAIGIGYFFGLELPRNFLTPYLSANATEFWRRWHITLSSWIRDYIYIGLGGSRRGIPRKYFNLFLAMTLSGIWHGALWTFAIWGMFHGALLILHNLYMSMKQKLKLTWLDKSFIYRVIAVIVFFHLTCIGWVFFRIHDLQGSLELLRRMLSPDALAMPVGMKIYAIAVLGLFVFHILEHYLLTHSVKISAFWHKYFPSPVRAVAYAVLIVLVLLFMKEEETGFIYFQF
ncbi:MBOAT family O-acyltransferase [Paenibacillus eucommiae]|uniref:Alginate O-acetyltransferase complex protein AlgI n=1 Tax=Paenibacillus eucommiae TaxID=1355755 RepID=A0ABS4JAW9_9BACL|nr:MBOAT family protein [Paenibacillus eucommiae]MBP1996992.1 alginate O-acetyltransferase complex protein AlgI [Paenibacillus eucommiae]